MKKKKRVPLAVVALLLASLEARGASATLETLSCHADSARRVLFVSQILPGLREFATPTVTQHRLYVGADDTVYAFAF